MIEAKITGIPDLRAALKAVPAHLRKRVLRNALAKGARIVQKDARAHAPVMSSIAALKEPRRKPGTVKKAISVRTSKFASRRGDVGVFVGVKPAKGAKFRTRRSAGGIKTRVQVKASQRNTANDPFYWIFHEFGWTPASRAHGGGGKAGKRFRRQALRAGGSRKIAPKRFMQNAARLLPQARDAIIADIVPQIERLNRKGAIKP